MMWENFEKKKYNGEDERENFPETIGKYTYFKIGCPALKFEKN